MLFISIFNLYLAFQIKYVMHTAAYIVIFFQNWGIFYDILVLITSVIKSKSSEEFQKHFNIVNEILREDVEYVKSMRKGSVSFILLALLLSIIRLIIYLMRIVKSYTTLDVNVSAIVVYNISILVQFWVDCRYILEICVCLTFVASLGSMLKYFDRKIKLLEKEYQRRQQPIRKEEIDHFVNIYKDLASCGEKLNTIFSSQVCL